MRKLTTGQQKDPDPLRVDQMKQFLQQCPEVTPWTEPPDTQQVNKGGDVLSVLWAILCDESQEGGVRIAAAKWITDVSKRTPRSIQNLRRLQPCMVKEITSSPAAALSPLAKELRRLYRFMWRDPKLHSQGSTLLIKLLESDDDRVVAAGFATCSSSRLPAESVNLDVPSLGATLLRRTTFALRKQVLMLLSRLINARSAKAKSAAQAILHSLECIFQTSSLALYTQAEGERLLGLTLVVVQRMLQFVPAKDRTFKDSIFEWCVQTLTKVSDSQILVALVEWLVGQMIWFRPNHKQYLPQWKSHLERWFIPLLESVMKDRTDLTLKERLLAYVVEHVSQFDVSVLPVELNEEIQRRVSLSQRAVVHAGTRKRGGQEFTLSAGADGHRLQRAFGGLMLTATDDFEGHVEMLPAMVDIMVPFVLCALKDPAPAGGWQHREAAIFLFGCAALAVGRRYKAEVQEGIDIVCKHLHDEVPAVRAASISALMWVVRKLPDAYSLSSHLSAVLPLLEDGSAVVRKVAADTLDVVIEDAGQRMVAHAAAVVETYVRAVQKYKDWDTTPCDMMLLQLVEVSASLQHIDHNTKPSHHINHTA